MVRRRKTSTRRRPNAHRYHAKRRYGKRRRNPIVAAGGFGKDMAVSVAGGLAGVTVTRMLVGAVSGMLPMASGGIMRVILTTVAAFGTGKLFGAISPNFGAAAAFGGYMAAGSEALNVFAPSLGSSFGLRGLGAFVPAQFAVPEDSIRRGMQLAAPMPKSGVSGFPAVARF
jgi:hypothetical protein